MQSVVYESKFLLIKKERKKKKINEIPRDVISQKCKLAAARKENKLLRVENSLIPRHDKALLCYSYFSAEFKYPETWIELLFGQLDCFTNRLSFRIESL